MNPCMKIWTWRGWLTVVALAMVGLAALSWWAGSDLAIPDRRPLQDYHREFLANPSSHGVALEAFVLEDGTPCLMCLPRADGGLGERGRRLRSQLAERGLALPAPGRVVGNVVLVHGRNGRKEDYLLIAERLCAAGFRCLIPDMPAHGDHPQRHAAYGLVEAGLPARVLKEAAGRWGFDPLPAGLLGLSMGGSIAVHAATEPASPWQALVVISSFDALEKVVEHQASRLLGNWVGPIWTQAAGGVYRIRTGLNLTAIQPGQRAKQLSIPTLIAHGDRDRVVPMASGRRLYEAVPEVAGKQWLEIPSADHDNVLITDFPIYATVAEWFLRHTRPQAANGS